MVVPVIAMNNRGIPWKWFVVFIHFKIAASIAPEILDVTLCNREITSSVYVVDKPTEKCPVHYTDHRFSCSVRVYRLTERYVHIPAVLWKIIATR